MTSWCECESWCNGQDCLPDSYTLTAGIPAIFFIPDQQ